MRSMGIEVRHIPGQSGTCYSQLLVLPPFAYQFPKGYMLPSFQLVQDRNGSIAVGIKVYLPFCRNTRAISVPLRFRHKHRVMSHREQSRL